jgi:uncharacterized protein (TIGR00251 family)
MNTCIRVSEKCLYLDIKAAPGASRTQLVEVKNERLRVKIAAAPEHGKANALLCAFLAQLLDCPKRDLSLHTGAQSRLKTIAVPLSYQKKLETIIDALASPELPLDSSAPKT